MKFPCFGARAHVALTAVLIALLFQPSSPAITHANAPLDDRPMFFMTSLFVLQSLGSAALAGKCRQHENQMDLQGRRTMAAQPIVVGDMVYEGTWSGNLFALDRETGQARWKEDLSE